MTNPWHIVNVGEDAPTVVNSIIEIPKESRAKYELCKETGLLKLDRVLYSPFHYPARVYSTKVWIMIPWIFWFFRKSVLRHFVK